MSTQLSGVRIALLVANGFEQDEMTKPRAALQEAGARVDLISPEKSTVRGWKDNNWADTFDVDIYLSNAHPEDYKGLLLPGGVINPDRLRMIPEAIDFVKHFTIAGKPIAAICHGPWTLINAQAVQDRTMTSWPSIKVDLMNAGALWIDKQVVRDGNLVTSRKPDDIPEFNPAIIELFSGD